MVRTSKIVNFSLPPEVHRQVDELAQQRKTSRSEVLREALKQYIASERRWQQIRGWGEETARELGIKSKEDVDRIIHEYRKEKSKRKSST